MRKNKYIIVAGINGAGKGTLYRLLRLSLKASRVVWVQLVFAKALI